MHENAQNLLAKMCGCYCRYSCCIQGGFAFLKIVKKRHNMVIFDTKWAKDAYYWPKVTKNVSFLKGSYTPVTYKEVVIDVDRELLKTGKM
jgi:hypothetical protein